MQQRTNNSLLKSIDAECSWSFPNKWKSLSADMKWNVRWKRISAESFVYTLSLRDYCRNRSVVLLFHRLIDHQHMKIFFNQLTKIDRWSNNKNISTERNSTVKIVVVSVCKEFLSNLCCCALENKFPLYFGVVLFTGCLSERFVHREKFFLAEFEGFFCRLRIQWSVSLFNERYYFVFMFSIGRKKPIDFQSM